MCMYGGGRGGGGEKISTKVQVFRINKYSVCLSVRLSVSVSVSLSLYCLTEKGYNAIQASIEMGFCRFYRRGPEKGGSQRSARERHDGVPVLVFRFFRVEDCR